MSFARNDYVELLAQKITLLREYRAMQRERDGLQDAMNKNSEAREELDAQIEAAQALMKLSGYSPTDSIDVPRGVNQ